MSDFNIHSWKKNQYLAEAGLGSSQAQSLAKLIDDAIMQVDESLSYRDFAVAVAIILKEEYGSHNFGKFMEVLHAELGMKESLNENISQEVVNKVSRFITSIANYYDYSEQDAVYAIMQALRAHKGNFQGLNEATEEDKIDTITMDVPLFIRVLEYAKEDAKTDMDLHDLAEKAIAATKQQGLLQMDDYDMLVGDLKQIGMEENMSLDDQAKAYYLTKVKAGEIDTLPENPKAAFLAQMTKDQIDHDKETLRRERGLEEKIREIVETIKLGQNLNEELCEKGKRYIKARQAAGEKSSAYLSGRAVRVCKGQIEWPKKGKKKK